MRTQSWTLDRTKYLTGPQHQELVAYCRDASDLDESRGRRNMVVGWLMVHVGLSAGLRVAEIQDLRIGDCHVGYGESHLHVRNGKGGKPGNVIVGEKLKAHVKRFLRLKKRRGEDMSRDAHLLLSERGEAYTRSGLQKKFKAVAGRAGLPKYFSVHCLRHTFCCSLLRESKNLRLVQKQARHSSITTTTVYADVADDEIQVAMDALR
jgi:integrase/recombinase XerC